MTGYLHVTVSRADFTLLRGREALIEYRFNTGVANHLFCGRCGIKSFYVPRSHPNAYSVNFNCLVLPEGTRVNVGNFDGRNWEQHVHELAHLGH